MFLIMFPYYVKSLFILSLILAEILHILNPIILRLKSLLWQTYPSLKSEV